MFWKLRKLRQRLIKGDSEDRKAACGELLKEGWKPRNAKEVVYFHIAKGEIEACGKFETEAVRPLIASLEIIDAENLPKAIEIIGRHGGVKEIGRLVLYLEDENADVREAAIEAFGRCGKSSFKILQPGLKSDKPKIRAGTARALGLTREENAIKPLVETLWDPEYDVRRAAAEGLASFGKPAMGVLLDLLSERLIGEIAAYSLSQMGGGVMEAVFKRVAEPEFRRNAGEVFVRIGEPAIEFLIEKFKDGAMRKYSEDIISRLGPVAIDPLVKSMQSQNGPTRLSASNALDKMAWSPISSEEKVIYLIAKNKIEECEKLGAAAVRPLVCAMRDPLIRPLAMQTLAKIGKPAVRPLVRALYHKETRREAIEALPLLGGLVIPDLKRVLREKDAEIRQGAGSALEKLAWEPGSAEDSVYYSISLKQFDNCVRHRDIAAPILINLLWDDDWFSRKSAAETLNKIDHYAAIEPLAKVILEYADVTADTNRPAGRRSKVMKEAWATASTGTREMMHVMDTYNEIVACEATVTALAGLGSDGRNKLASLLKYDLPVKLQEIIQDALNSSRR